MQQPNSHWQELLSYWQELADIHGIDALLGWDQSTYLPAQAAAGRARQQGIVARLQHAKGTDAAYSKLLEQALNRTDLSPAQQRMVKLAHKEFERQQRLPAAFVSELSQHYGDTYSAWTVARPNSDFATMQPLLEKTLDLSLKTASYFPEFADPMDYFIDLSDEGMSAQQIDSVFAELHSALIPLIDMATQASAPRTDFLRRHYPTAAQLQFGESVIKDYGYDFTQGRQDLTHHPFMTRLGNHDTRITTRVRENDPTDALYSTLHEAGHAMYEQGIASEYLGTPLGGGVSSGVHESQSRLWENLVGRSREFWQAYFGKLRDTFPQQLADVTEDEMYRACNSVSRSLIRTDADELTYNLHVIIRYNLERQLLSGQLSVRDLPDAWHAAYQQGMGLQAPNHTDGVLQDVHWYFGPIGGAFQGYTLGNVLSAQFYAAAEAALPTLSSDIARADFSGLHGWLREHVYQHGARYTPDELVKQATGQAMTAAPYLNYLREKYQGLYQH